MQDSQIIELYFMRDEQAIVQSAEKYGVYCTSIAQNILRNLQDSEECVNDTWLSAWNSIPPAKPSVLKTYLGKITRNLA
ncbi:MAG: RNA polymerase subunit sigma-70, partial [Clostridia bacterium]|nr:RNA polymerase subunit sigma-70 [Clostridia bacterium]